MKPEEARDLIGMMKAGTRGLPLQDEEVGFWEMQLERLDADLATKAVLAGVRDWTMFPAWSEFYDAYKVQQRLSSPDTYYRSPDPPPNVREVPFWVKRLIAARYLYRRFGKSRDMRPFGEQVAGLRELRSYHGGADKSGYTIPTQKELMPESEWVEEAKRVSDEDVWRTIRSQRASGASVDIEKLVKVLGEAG